MKNITARSICEGAIVSAITVVLIIFGMYVPIFSLLSIFICGLPLVYLMIKQGTKISIISCVASLIVIFIITGDLISGPLSALISMLPALAIGYSMSKEQTYYITLIYGTIGVLVGFLINIMVYTILIDNGSSVSMIIDESISGMRNLLSASIGNISESSANLPSTKELLTLVDEVLAATKVVILTYFPAMLIIISAVLGFLVTSVSFFFMRRLKASTKNYIEFSMFAAPKSMCTIAVILMIITFFMKGDSLPTLALKNVAVVLSFILFVNGLAFTDFKLSLKVKSGYMRALIYLGIFILGYIFISTIYYTLMLVGMVDANLDLRRLRSVGDSDEN